MSTTAFISITKVLEVRGEKMKLAQRTIRLEDGKDVGRLEDTFTAPIETGKTWELSSYNLHRDLIRYLPKE